MHHRAPRHSPPLDSSPRRSRRGRIGLTSLLTSLALALALTPAGFFGTADPTETTVESASHYRPWWSAWFSVPRFESSASRAAPVTAAERRERAARKSAAGKASPTPATKDSRQTGTTAGSMRTTGSTAPSSTVAKPTPAASGATAAGRPGTTPARPIGANADGILLSHDELTALPTAGPGWDAIMARIKQPRGGSYTLGTRDDANTDVLAHALGGARLDNAGYKAFVRDKIERIMTSPRNTEDLLATLRQLQTYIISADLIDLASFDPALDARFRTWLAAEVRFQYSGGGGGGSVISNHDKKPNNYGTHAGTTRLAAALYLGDEAELEAARDIWYGYTTGDPAYSHPTRKWTGTTWQCDPARPAGINAAGCTRDGRSLDGVLPEDQRRCGEFTVTPCATNYIHGATDGMTLSFWMLARQGEDVWNWGNQAALRQMQWKYANGQPPYSGFRWQIPVIERAYGIDLPGNTPSATSTNFGFAEWWAQ